MNEIMKAYQLPSDYMGRDVAACSCYHSDHRFHAANNCLSPINYEVSRLKRVRDCLARASSHR